MDDPSAHARLAEFLGAVAPGLAHRLDLWEDTEPLFEAAGVETEIENGLGILLLRGLPRDRYSAEEMGLIYWGIGAHFGRPVAQNAQGDVLGHVRDLGRDQYKDMHARGYQTASLLPFHNDSLRADTRFLDLVRRIGIPTQ